MPRAPVRTEGDAEVAERAAGDGHVDGELGVAEGGEEGADAGNGVGQDDGRAGALAAGPAGGDEDAGAHHAADAEPDEVEPAEGPGHARPGPGADPAHLLPGRGHRPGPAGQASRRLGQRPQVGSGAREGGAVAAALHFLSLSLSATPFSVSLLIAQVEEEEDAIYIGRKQM